MNAALFKTSIAGLTIRSATEADTAVLLDFIRQLAAFEKLADKVVATEAVLRASLFGTRPYAEALIAELDGKPAAFAIFFTRFRVCCSRLAGHGLGVAAKSGLMSRISPMRFSFSGSGS